MKSWQYLLFPFSVLYDIATRFRNHLYNIGYKPSFEFEINLICVGNIAVGGTGKTPMVAYLMEKLHQEQKITTLSRGYKRKTRGFRIAGDEDSSESLGDEPYLFYKRYGKVANVTVSEDRAFAIPQIIYELPDTDMILMDDGFQHRTVKPSFSIILSSYQRPFYEDLVLPAGRLRESRKNITRADVVVITKCPIDISQKEQDAIKLNVQQYNSTIKVFFTSLEYNQPQKINTDKEISNRVVAVAGIANANTYFEYCRSKYEVVREFEYSDHHYFTNSEIEKWVQEAQSQEADILMTEKDFVKLDVENLNRDISFYYQPVQQKFIKGEEDFLQIVKGSLKEYEQNQ